MSKILKITDELRDLIKAKEFADGKLPPERALALQFGCCRKTIRTALANLESDGWIDRCRKKGTTVKKSLSDSKGLVGLIMPENGHFFSGIYNNLKKSLLERGYTVQSINTDIIIKNLLYVSARKQQILKNAVKNLINSNPDIIIANVYMCYKIPLFSKLCNQNMIFIDHNAYSCKFKIPSVLLDYEKAGWLGGKYLIEQKCKRPIYFPRFFSLTSHLLPDLYNLHKEKMLTEGFRKAMIEGGITPDTAILNSWAISPKEYKKLLTALSTLSNYMPDGFMSVDSNVAFFMNKLIENHGKIPENMVFAGLYNTPWSIQDALQPFPSIDFNIGGIVDAVLNMVELPFEKRKNICIEPELIIRGRNKL